MPLSDEQIDRYSRQIIVPGIGGVGQERLLRARMILSGELTDIEAVLAYLVGAGVGTIFLDTESGEAAVNSIVQEMRALNPDVAVGAHPAGSISLVAAMVASGAAGSRAEASLSKYPDAPAVIARLTRNAELLVRPASSPCVRCIVSAGLLSGVGDRSWNAGFVAAIAATEIVKLLASERRSSAAKLIHFDGYESRTDDFARDDACDCWRATP